MRRSFADITGGLALLLVYEVLWRDFLGWQHDRAWRDTRRDREHFFDLMVMARRDHPEMMRATFQGLFDKYGVEAMVQVGRRL